MKKALVVLVVGLLSFVLAFLAFYRRTPNKDSTKIQIVASFYPLYEFAKEVGGDKVEVYNMTPAGSEPHDFEPTPYDIAVLMTANLFVFNGNLESWSEKASQAIPPSVKVINMSKYLNLGGDDPHFWLDPLIAKVEVNIIEKALSELDPVNQNYYKANAESYISKLSKLDREFKHGLSQCMIRDVVVSHKALTYLSQRYNFNAISISGLSPDEEPTPAKLSEIITKVRQKNIKYIFFETLVSPKLSETIANEVGAQTLVFDPIEGLADDRIKEGKNYISIQEENLLNLEKAMECK